MAEVFKCPACAAPLEFEGKMMQKCLHCGSSVIVPADAMRQSNVFGNEGSLDFSDLSNVTGKALKIAEIQRLIQQRQKIYAIKVFRETFNTGLKEAKDAVDAMERGESVDISGMRIQGTAPQGVPVNSGAVKKPGCAAGSILLAAFIIIFAGILIGSFFR